MNPRDVRDAALPLRTPTDLDPLLDAIGEARVVLLGEASHGTSEFYTWRAELSKRLIVEKSFSFIAVEGDWPDCYRVNRWVKGMHDDATAEGVLHAFGRWPTWMWANRDVVSLVEWMRAHNHARPATDRVGFYGLDVYSLWESMSAVIDYLERTDPGAVARARAAYGCFDPYRDDAHAYARATAIVPASCAEETVAMLRMLRARAPEYPGDGRDALFDAEQNAIIARDAERYYRAMIGGGPTSWNIRDHHMVDTLERLLTFHGPGSKAIVWEHNTHIGDARFTDMTRAGMISVGQLVRESHGERGREPEGAVLVGFGTRHGTVIAAPEWGAPMDRFRIPAARPGSLEDVLHDAIAGDCLLCFNGSDDGGIAGLGEPLDHRAIGVVYRPEAEPWGNYVPTIVPRRYDAFLFIDESHAVDPLHMPVIAHGEALETYPSGA